jgi:hypothetical protein
MYTVEGRFAVLSPPTVAVRDILHVHRFRHPSRPQSLKYTTLNLARPATNKNDAKMQFDINQTAMGYSKQRILVSCPSASETSSVAEAADADAAAIRSNDDGHVAVVTAVTKISLMMTENEEVTPNQLVLADAEDEDDDDHDGDILLSKQHDDVSIKDRDDSSSSSSSSSSSIVSHISVNENRKGSSKSNSSISDRRPLRSRSQKRPAAANANANANANVQDHSHSDRGYDQEEEIMAALKQKILGRPSIVEATDPSASVLRVMKKMNQNKADHEHGTTNPPATTDTVEVQHHQEEETESETKHKHLHFRPSVVILEEAAITEPVKIRLNDAAAGLSRKSIRRGVNKEDTKARQPSIVAITEPVQMRLNDAAAGVSRNSTRRGVKEDNSTKASVVVLEDETSSASASFSIQNNRKDSSIGKHESDIHNPLLVPREESSNHRTTTTSTTATTVTGTSNGTRSGDKQRPAAGISQPGAVAVAGYGSRSGDRHTLTASFGGSSNNNMMYYGNNSNGQLAVSTSMTMEHAIAAEAVVTDAPDADCDDDDCWNEHPTQNQHDDEERQEQAIPIPSPLLDTAHVKVVTPMVTTLSWLRANRARTAVMLLLAAIAATVIIAVPMIAMQRANKAKQQKEYDNNNEAAATTFTSVGKNCTTRISCIEGMLVERLSKYYDFLLMPLKEEEEEEQQATQVKLDANGSTTTNHYFPPQEPPEIWDDAFRQHQRRLIEWLAYEDPLQVSLEDPDRLLQRYAAAAFYDILVRQVNGSGGSTDAAEQESFTYNTSLHECEWSLLSSDLFLTEKDKEQLVVDMVENDDYPQPPPPIAMDDDGGGGCFVFDGETMCGHFEFAGPSFDVTFGCDEDGFIRDLHSGKYVRLFVRSFKMIYCNEFLVI